MKPVGFAAACLTSLSQRLQRGSGEEQSADLTPNTQIAANKEKGSKGMQSSQNSPPSDATADEVSFLNKLKYICNFFLI